MLPYDSQKTPVMKAAKMALETGNANYVLIWVPEESANIIKNLLEKTCCELNLQNDLNTRSIDWYFETVNRLHNAYRWTQRHGMKSGGIDEDPVVQVVGKAIEMGNFYEIAGIIPDTHAGEVRQRFYEIVKKKNYPVNDIRAGRDFVSSFIDLIVFLRNLPLRIPEKTGSPLN